MKMDMEYAEFQSDGNIVGFFPFFFFGTENKEVYELHVFIFFLTFYHENRDICHVLITDYHIIYKC